MCKPFYIAKINSTYISICWKKKYSFGTSWNSLFISEGAFKKLKNEPIVVSVSSPIQHPGHTPTTASCPTPARRRHRTTFTQVRIIVIFYNIYHLGKVRIWIVTMGPRWGKKRGTYSVTHTIYSNIFTGPSRGVAEEPKITLIFLNFFLTYIFFMAFL